jgi:predicted kinase
MMRGLPASGKSLYIKRYMKGIKRISKDDLRGMIDGGVYSPENETVILTARDHLVILFLARGHDVVVDDCNMNPDHEKTLRAVMKSIPLQEEDEFRFIIVDISATVQECIDRNRMRDNPVAEEAIKRMAEKYDYSL